MGNYCPFFLVSGAMCHVSGVRCLVSCVMCHMLLVTCHLTNVTNSNSHSHSHGKQATDVPANDNRLRRIPNPTDTLRNPQAKPPPPRLPSDETMAPPGSRTINPNLHEELGLLLQAPDSAEDSELSPCSCELGPDTDKPTEGTRTTRQQPTPWPPKTQTAKPLQETIPRHEPQAAGYKPKHQSTPQGAPQLQEGDRREDNL